MFKIGLIRFLSPILTESLLIFFILVTEMFQFTKFLLFSFAFNIRFPFLEICILQTLLSTYNVSFFITSFF